MVEECNSYKANEKTIKLYPQGETEIMDTRVVFSQQILGGNATGRLRLQVKLTLPKLKSPSSVAIQKYVNVCQFYNNVRQKFE